MKRVIWNGTYEEFWVLYSHHFVVSDSSLRQNMNNNHVYLAIPAIWFRLKLDTKHTAKLTMVLVRSSFGDPIFWSMACYRLETYNYFGTSSTAWICIVQPLRLWMIDQIDPAHHGPAPCAVLLERHVPCVTFHWGECEWFAPSIDSVSVKYQAFLQ